MSTEKVKKGKRLPTHIQYSVILSYFVVEFVLIGILLVVGNVMGNMRELATPTFGFVIPILALIIGLAIKWFWAKGKGTEEQQVRVRAQVWSTIGFFVAFVATILLILIFLIMLEMEAFLPQNLPDVFAWVIGGLLLVIGTGIAWNTRQRILRNFGY